MEPRSSDIKSQAPPLSFRELLSTTTTALLASPHLSYEAHDQAQSDAQLLMVEALGVAVHQLYSSDPAFSTPGNTGELELLERMIQARRSGEPMAYVLGWVPFYREHLRVNHNTLIPRPETEELVELLADDDFLLQAPVRRILDLGTGSGCLAVSLARIFPRAQVLAVDICPDALQVARYNMASYNLEDRVTAMQGDMLSDRFWSSQLWSSQHGRGELYDLIVCNPPYVRTSAAEQELLSLETRQFEPARALYAGTDGLDFFRAMLPHIPALLSSDRSSESGLPEKHAMGGMFAAEMGYQQAQPLRALSSQLYHDLSCSPSPKNSSATPAESSQVQKSSFDHHYDIQVQKDLSAKERFFILKKMSLPK